MSLAWPNHVHHGHALAWFRRRGGQPWATTPVTEAGFVRVSSNASAIPDAVTPIEAVMLLARMRETAGHRFLADDIPLLVDAHVAVEQIATYRVVSDAHLLALARRHGARLATLDRGIATLARGMDLVLVPLA